MNTTMTKLVIKFFNLLLSESENTLIELKEMLMNWYENGELTSSEHCQLEALIDAKFGKL